MCTHNLRVIAQLTLDAHIVALPSAGNTRARDGPRVAPVIIGATERSMTQRDVEMLRTVCTHAHTIETDRRTDSNFARD